MISNTTFQNFLKISFDHLYKGVKIFCFIGLLGILVGCVDKKQDNKEEPEEVPNWLIFSQYLEQNKLDEAEAALHKIISMDPENPAFYAELGSIYLKLGKYKEAEDQLAHALKLDGEEPEFHLILAEIHHRSGNDKRAVQELKQIIEKNPDNAKAYYMLASIYGEGGPESIANRKEYLEKIIDLLPANVVPLMDLIQLEAQQGNTHLECNLKWKCNVFPFIYESCQ